MVATDFDSVVRKPGRLIGINPATIYDGSAPLAMLMKSIDSEGSTSRSRGQPPDPCLNLNLVADPAQPLGFFRHLGGFTAGPDSTKNSTDSWTGSSKLRQPSSMGHRPRLANSASQHMGSIKGSWEEDLKDTHAGRDFLLPF
jgi:hypothetical protein